MPSESELLRRLSPEQRSALEQVLGEFEEAWRQGRRPALDEHVPSQAELRLAALLELTHIDLEYRFKSGEPVSAEDYLRRFPELRRQPGAAADLVAAEYNFRRRGEPGLTPATFLARYPGHQDELAERLAGIARQAPGGTGPARQDVSEATEGVTVPLSPAPHTGKAPAPPSLLGTQACESAPVIPGYEILEVVSRGGMGIVYKARQIKANRVVALKVILTGGQASAAERARFHTETEAVARLQHPNIVQVFEVGEHNGIPFFSLEYCPAGSLAARLSGSTLPPREAASLVAALASAMHEAHQRQVIHRDLKPANVLLAGGGPETPLPLLTPKVADFGLARKLDDSLRTQSGAVLGTPCYMAPEQASGQSRLQGPGCDVYALGAILYEDLTGRPPFKAATSTQTLFQVLHDEPVPPRRLMRTPTDLETICLKCLEKNPERRYPTALELAQDLGRFLKNEPIRARPVGLWERSRKSARRRPLAALLVVMSLLAVVGLAGAVVGFTAYLRRALEQRTVELRREQEANERERRQRRYLTDIQLGYQLWKNGETEQTRELLAAYQPRQGETDPRSFDYYYLWRQCDRLRGVLPAHEGGVFRAVFAPNGKLLATAGADGRVKLWDASPWGSGEVPATTSPVREWTGHAGPIRGLCWSPDGTVLCSGGDDGAIRLWDVARGQELVRLAGNLKAIACLDVSADGKWLAAGGGDGQVKVWDLSLRTERATLGGHKGVVGAVVFSPDSRVLVSADTFGWFNAWDVPAGAHLVHAHRDVAALCFSPDGRQLAAGLGSGGVTVGDLPFRAGPPPAGPAVMLAGHQGKVTCVTCTPEGRRASGSVISSAEDGTVRIWDTTRSRARLILRGHRKTVHALALAPGCPGLLVSAGADGCLRFWDIASLPGGEGLEPTLVPAGPLALAPDGKTLAVVEANGVVRLIDPADGRVKAACRGHRGPIRALVFSPDGRSLATAGEDGTVRLWDQATGKERHCFTGHQASGGREPPVAVACVAAFSPDCRTLGSGAGHEVKLWDAETGRERATLPGHAGSVRHLGFLPGGQTLLSQDEAAFRLWDAGTAKLRSQWSPGSPVSAVAIAPRPGEGPEPVLTLATVIRRERFDCGTPSGAALATLPFQFDGDDPARPDGCVLVFSPDGQTLVAGGRGQSLKFWDAVSHRQTNYLFWSSAPVSGLSFSGDSRTLAISSEDSAVTLLDTVPWRLSRPAGQLPPPVRALCFSGDGRTLITGSGKRVSPGGIPEPITYARRFLTAGIVWDHAMSDGDGIGLWDVASRRQLPGLPGQEGSGVLALALGPDHRALVAGGREEVVWLWDLKEGVRRQESGVRKTGPLTPDSCLLTPLFPNPQAQAEWRKWEVACAVGAPIRPEFQALRDLALAADGRLLAATDHKGTIRLWELPSGRDLGTLAGPPGKRTCLGFSPDGATLAAGNGDQVELWDLATPGRPGTQACKLRRTLQGHEGEVQCLVFSPGGARLATGGRDRTIKLWDWQEGRERASLIGHTDTVSSLSFTSDGRVLASGSWDGTVRLWSVSAGQELGSLDSHRGKVHALCFSPDGATLATGGETPEGSGEVYLWRTNQGEQGAGKP